MTEGYSGSTKEIIMRISEMTESQYSTYLRGVSDGEHNAINACFGGLRSTPAFDSQEEYDLYHQGYDAGYDAID